VFTPIAARNTVPMLGYAKHYVSSTNIIFVHRLFALSGFFHKEYFFQILSNSKTFPGPDNFLFSRFFRMHGNPV